MIQIITILLWIIATLAVTSFAVVIGRKYGAEYPIAIMAGLVVMAAVLANKIVTFGPFTVPGGVIVFSTTFLITDILSEVWGKRYAKKAVWAGFYANVILIISLYIVIAWESPAFMAERSSMFAEILGLTPRIAVAGMITYLVSQNHDVWAFHYWKKQTDGKMLWFRNIASTVQSQLIDSVLFTFIAFYGVFPIFPLIIGAWVVKVIIAILDTPFMYLMVYIAKRIRPAKNARPVLE